MAGSPGPAERLNGGGKLNVLVVDDHAVVQWGFRLLLGRQPWIGRCGAASNPDEALELAKTSEPDVALVDLFLGERSGAELCEAIREISPKTRVRVSSGVGWLSTTTLRGRTWLRAGVINYLSTETDADAILDTLVSASEGILEELDR